MTPPVRPEMDFNAWKAEQDFNAWKAQQAPAVDPRTAARQAEFASGRLAERMSSENVLDRAANRSPLDEIGAGFQNLVGQGTFGTVGLLDDALSSLRGPGTFGERLRASREARKSSREQLPTSARLATGIPGAIANPINRILPVAAATRGLLFRTALGTGESALQGGLGELGENIGTEGAGSATAWGATGGVAGRALGGTAVGLFRGGRELRRTVNAESLEQALLRRTDTRKVVDDVMYDVVRQEAARTGTSSGLRKVLADATVAPFARIVRESREFADANDATVFLEAYKRMSEVERAKVHQMDGAPEWLASVSQKIRDIGGAKADMRGAAGREGLEPVEAILEGPEGRMVDLPGGRSGTAEVVTPPPLPTFPTAVGESAKSASEIAAFKRTAKIVDRVIHGKRVDVDKMQKTSPEVALREMRLWTPGQAMAGLEALYGHSKTAGKLTDQFISGFGRPSAVVRSARLPARIRPFAQVLEEQALLRSPMPSVSDRLLPGTTSRVGGLLAPR